MHRPPKSLPLPPPPPKNPTFNARVNPAAVQNSSQIDNGGRINHSRLSISIGEYYQRTDSKLNLLLTAPTPESVYNFTLIVLLLCKNNVPLRRICKKTSSTLPDLTVLPLRSHTNESHKIMFSELVMKKFKKILVQEQHRLAKIKQSLTLDISLEVANRFLTEFDSDDKLCYIADSTSFALYFAQLSSIQLKPLQLTPIQFDNELLRSTGVFIVHLKLALALKETGSTTLGHKLFISDEFVRELALPFLRSVDRFDELIYGARTKSLLAHVGECFEKLNSMNDLNHLAKELITRSSLPGLKLDALRALRLLSIRQALSTNQLLTSEDFLHDEVHAQWQSSAMQAIRLDVADLETRFNLNRDSLSGAPCGLFLPVSPYESYLILSCTLFKHDQGLAVESVEILKLCAEAWAIPTTTQLLCHLQAVIPLFTESLVIPCSLLLSMVQEVLIPSHNLPITLKSDKTHILALFINLEQALCTMLHNFTLTMFIQIEDETPLHRLENVLQILEIIWSDSRLGLAETRKTPSTISRIIHDSFIAEYQNLYAGISSQDQITQRLMSWTESISSHLYEYSIYDVVPSIEHPLIRNLDLPSPSAMILSSFQAEIQNWVNTLSFTPNVDFRFVPGLRPLKTMLHGIFPERQVDDWFVLILSQWINQLSGTWNKWIWRGIELELNSSMNGETYSPLVDEFCRMVNDGMEILRGFQWGEDVQERIWRRFIGVVVSSLRMYLLHLEKMLVIECTVSADKQFVSLTDRDGFYLNTLCQFHKLLSSISIPTTTEIASQIELILCFESVSSRDAVDVEFRLNTSNGHVSPPLKLTQSHYPTFKPRVLLDANVESVEIEIYLRGIYVQSKTLNLWTEDEFRFCAVSFMQGQMTFIQRRAKEFAKFQQDVEIAIMSSMYNLGHRIALSSIYSLSALTSRSSWLSPSNSIAESDVESRMKPLLDYLDLNLFRLKTTVDTDALGHLGRVGTRLFYDMAEIPWSMGNQDNIMVSLVWVMILDRVKIFLQDKSLHSDLTCMNTMLELVKAVFYCADETTGQAQGLTMRELENTLHCRVSALIWALNKVTSE